MTGLRLAAGAGLGLILATSRLAAADDIVVADFEGRDWGDWTVEGEAFGAAPAQGTLPGQMQVSGFLGRGLVNSYVGLDGTVGRLTSPPLVVERPFLNFLIGGGQHPGETCINLLLDGTIVLTATGPNDRPGGSEMLDWATWDLRPYLGKRVVIEIVDTNRGGWGHINIDQITQSDTPKVEPPELLFPNSDFEQGNLANWTPEGEAMTVQPTKGDNPQARGRADHAMPQGWYWIGTFERYDGTIGQPGAARGDEPTGNLTSAPFTLRQPWLNFLVGSGKLPGEAGVEILIDGQPKYRATGFDSETMKMVSADVSRFAGQTAQIRIFDQASGGWGHVNADAFTGSAKPMSDVRLPNLDDITEFSMKLQVHARYLHLPVKNGAAKVIFELRHGDELVRDFDLELSTEGEPDWYAFYDIGQYDGGEIELRAREPLDKQAAARLAERITQSDQAVESPDLYHERLRPQLHFTSRRGWNNDPNGLVYLAGEYHLFYQHNPFGIGWGNMHWGHAVSRDLVHWEELPIALYQRGLHDMAFSGGGNVDTHHTAGWGDGHDPVLFVSFTSTGRGECLAFSTDNGRTLTEYEGNPILKHRGRDPRIVWYEPEQKWILIVYDETDTGWRYAFHESKDLKTWRYLSDVPGFYECPDFFELPLDGDAGRRKWVLYGAQRREEGGQRDVARSSYVVGTFDGHAFHAETPVLDGHRGPNYYAAQSFANAPDGRHIMLGWLAGANYPGMPFSQGFTVPLELSLRSTAAGPRLCFYPVKELDALRRGGKSGDDLTVAQANELLAAVDAELLDIALAVRPAGADLTVDVRGVPVIYHAGEGTLTFRNTTAPVALPEGVLKLRVLVDRGVMEVFGDDGLVAFSAGGELFGDGSGPARLTAAGEAQVTHLEVHELSAIWP